MGEVWRARDTRLGRDVAIKALPAAFALDVDRLARFEREAKVLASLNHSNIAAIYGLEQADGERFLVLELVEGETLAERLARGSMPLQEALRAAVQIADAIEAAHDREIVHRDLKPANVKITPDGKVKVLDFGLAKAFDVSGAATGVLDSPTMSLAATAQGVILGTAAYMSPEQARGQAVDRRTDIWAFGCVLYEMLAGRKAFRGDHVTDILASVLAREPEYADLPASLPPRLKDALRRCLEKEPKRRWGAIGDLRVELEGILADPTGGLPATAPARSSRLALLITAAAAALAAAAGAWLLKPAPRESARPIVRFSFAVAPTLQTLRGPSRPVFALSPDGRHVAYNLVTGIFVRAMDSLTPRLIPGTEATSSTIFFSPDGEWLGYWSAAAEALQKIRIGGGAPVTIATTVNPLDAHWGRDGNILFATAEGIWRVSADGGTPNLVINTAGTSFVSTPTLLPDGATILYSQTGGPASHDGTRPRSSRNGPAASPL